MSYYVIGPDGSRYGPADMETLRQWVIENRLNPFTMLEDVATAQRFPASSQPGLFPTMAAPQQAQYPAQNPMGQFNQMESQLAPGNPNQFGNQYAQPPVPGQYPRMNYDDSTTNLTWAFVLFGFGAVCCYVAPLVCPFGLWQANQAVTKGNPTGKVARILNIVMMCLGGAVWIFYILLFAIGFSSASGNF